MFEKIVVRSAFFSATDRSRGHASLTWTDMHRRHASLTCTFFRREGADEQDELMEIKWDKVLTKKKNFILSGGSMSPLSWMSEGWSSRQNVRRFSLSSGTLRPATATPMFPETTPCSLRSPWQQTCPVWDWFWSALDWECHRGCQVPVLVGDSPKGEWMKLMNTLHKTTNNIWITSQTVDHNKKSKCYRN